ncbi:hypothetical protein HPB51_020164 [Rhipicephalus microplus]|uniref:PiggyBac transposable element-derived protein domain-containing protein n=1 Tax=Rhipicephalus microplus TaxID=6941 RepID=A0A9J6F5U5_RHIMP|nr:hypothetical protein HPB51_020164 [Rhipicephalus microplus]
MISYCRIKAQVNKWTIRSIFQLFDIALSNSWMQYVQNMRAQQKRQKEIVKFLEFHLSVASFLLEMTVHQKRHRAKLGAWSNDGKTTQTNQATSAKQFASLFVLLFLLLPT